MSFVEEAEAVARLYRKAPPIVLLALQQDGKALLRALNEVRMERNFAGYERDWQGTHDYSRFLEWLDRTIVPPEEETIAAYRGYLKQALAERPPWFERFAAAHERNRAPFEALTAQAGRPIAPATRALYSEALPPAYGTEELPPDDSAEAQPGESAIARTAISEVGLRLAYATDGSTGNRALLSHWMERSYVIILSDLFGQDR